MADTVLVWITPSASSPALRLMSDTHSTGPSFGILGLVAVAILTATLSFVRGRRGTLPRVLGAAILVGGLVLFLWFQRYCLYGVFLFGGGRYWVHQAAVTPSEAIAKNQLRMVLSASQYGVNTAENAVHALPSTAAKRRLFRLLAECAPNDNWRSLYLQDADALRGSRP